MSYLGIDLGTTNCKVLVTDEDGTILSRASMPVELIRSPAGGIEQSLSGIYSALCAAVRQATEGYTNTIEAIGVSSQGGALQLFDKNRKPLGNIISWMDERGTPYDDRLTAELGKEYFLEHIGFHKSSLCIGQLMRLAETGELSRAVGVGFVGDSIVENLCGTSAHDATSFAITFLYNPWTNSADDDLLARISAKGKQFPSLLRANAIAGYLTAEAARNLNLPAGIPISPAVHDQYAASLAAGAVEPGDVCIGTGTAWVLTATTAKLALPMIEGAYICHHPAGGGGQLISLNTGGGAIAQVMHQMGERRFTSSRVDELILATPADCHGVTCIQLRNSDIQFSGENSCPSLGDRIRAVVAALAEKLRNYLEQLSARGFGIHRLILSGPAAASEPVSQILADTINMPLVCLTESDVSAYGVTLLAASLGGSRDNLKHISNIRSLAGVLRQPVCNHEIRIVS